VYNNDPSVKPNAGGQSLRKVPNQAVTRLRGTARGRAAKIIFNGRSLEAFEGEMLAAALMAAGVVLLRTSPRAGTPRGAFCLMGVCQECLVLIEGKVRQSCMTVVHDGLTAETLPRLPGADM